MITTMLDTNITSDIIKEDPKTLDYFYSKPLHEFCISTITESEILYGLKRKPKAKKLHQSARDLLSILTICPWDRTAAQAYSELRTQANKEGKNLSTMDMLIASHSYGLDLDIMTNDKAFRQFKKWLNVVSLP